MGVSFVFVADDGVYWYALFGGDAVADCVAEDGAYHACACGVVYCSERHEYCEADEADEGDERFGGVSYRHRVPLVVLSVQWAKRLFLRRSFPLQPLYLLNGRRLLFLIYRYP